MIDFSPIYSRHQYQDGVQVIYQKIRLDCQNFEQNIIKCFPEYKDILEEISEVYDDLFRAHSREITYYSLTYSIDILRIETKLSFWQMIANELEHRDAGVGWTIQPEWRKSNPNAYFRMKLDVWINTIFSKV